MSEVNILVEAKKEYTSQLVKLLKPRLYEGFKSIYDDIINASSNELMENNVQNVSVTKTFQKMLKEIPLWNNEMVKNEYSRIEKISNCDYFDNLLEAVFITNTKILTSVQINDPKSINVKINIPQPSYFVHKCYIESAKEFYKNPYLFDQSKILTPKEKHNNLRDALTLIENSIHTAISSLLPIGDILKQGLTKRTNLSEERSVSKESETGSSYEDSEDDETEYTEETVDAEDPEDAEPTATEKMDETNNGNNVETQMEETHNENETNLDNIKITNDNEIHLDDIKIGGENNEIEKTITVTMTKEEDNIKLINLGGANENAEENNPIKYISQTPVIARKPLALDLNTHTNPEVESKPVELKKIDLTDQKSGLPFLSKINSIEKMDATNSINGERKVISSTPFIRTVKQNKFIKKMGGGGSSKMNSFYKKKYEENSANYNAHYNTEDYNHTLTSNVQTTLDDIKETRDSLKVIKNKIMLKDASSDEEDSVLEL